MKEDNYAKSRNHMVKRQLRIRGIFDQHVLDVFNKVPREKFIKKEQRPFAYGDHPLSIGHHQTISQPFIVALMTQALELKPTMKALEIGTGSGYQTAVLAHLAKEVYTIERIESLQENAKTVLDDLALDNIHYKAGNGKLGWPDQAPFDVILVAAATKEVPNDLKTQLKDGGKMVIPVGGQFHQSLMKIEKKDGIFKETDLGPCRFVPLM